MTTLQTRFIEPLDVLFLRGNKLFGDPGSYGEALIPPWPSLAAGALRSRILTDAGVNLPAFARGKVTHPELGTPQQPGSFAVTAFHLARRVGDQLEPLYAPPADLVPSRDAEGTLQVRALCPIDPLRLTPRAALLSSAPLPMLPVLAETQRCKPESGGWLTASGWRDYLAGRLPAAEQWLKSSELWSLDPRVGIGLDKDARCAAEGKLFSMQAVAFQSGVGFLAQVSGAHLPASGTLRLGGDGRAAAVSPADGVWPEPDYAAIAAAGRCRLVLTTPGLFGLPGAETGSGGGWLPTGITCTAAGDYLFDLHGVRARLVSAAIPRAEVVSGWDLAQWQPKSAVKAAPTGAVYWLDQLSATPEALRRLIGQGLWSETCEDPARRAEGFNRALLAAWAPGEPA